MKILKTIGIILIIAFLLVVVAGIYKFNFTNDDIYVENDKGGFVQIDDL